MIYENLMINWNNLYKNSDDNPKIIVLQRGERKDGDEMMVFHITDISKVILQLLKDILYFIETECEFELDAIPDDYITYFIKNGIDGGIICLVDKNSSNKGDLFNLTFEMIENLLNKSYIKDINLKYKVYKLYSCYEKYCEKYGITKELDNIKKIKYEISGLAEKIRKKMIFDGQIRRIKTGLTFDEFLYWIYLMKPGDKFAKNIDKDIFEIVEIKEYPQAPISDRYNLNYNYNALLLIKNSNSNEIDKFIFTQYPYKIDHTIRFLM